VRRLLLFLLTLSALAACRGFELAPWTRPGGFYQETDETEVTSNEAGTAPPEDTPPAENEEDAGPPPEMDGGGAKDAKSD
jgi:hypothetical protein